MNLSNLLVNVLHTACGRAVLAVTVLTLTTVVAGCTGGSRDSGDNVTLVGGDDGGSDNGGNSPDPVVLEIPIAYIQRPLPEEPDDLRDPLAFNPGARLLVRRQASSRVEEEDLTPRIREIIASEESVDPDELQLDIKDLAVSYDGALLAFAVRGVPEPVDANLELTTWNLWQYEFASGDIDYLIASPINRNGNNDRHDTAPFFLANDDLVFSSTRQTGVRGRQLDEGRVQYPGLDEDRSQPASVLHVLDPETDSIRQISYNQSHDLFPAVLDDGRIVFSRWDNAAGNDRISLYTIYPSGRALSLLYGYNSHDSGNGVAQIEFTRPRPMADGRLLTLVRPANSTVFGGNVLLLDTANYADHDQPLWHNRSATGSGQSPLTQTEIRSDGLNSAGGLFSAAWPLYDGTGRVLVGWSDCRAEVNGLFRPCTIAPDDAPPAPPLYGLWMYDPVENIQRPVVQGEEGMMFSEVVAAEPRSFPGPADDSALVDGRLSANEGLLRIDSVYQLDDTDVSPAGIGNHRVPDTAPFLNRPARFLRIVAPVPIPDDDVQDIPNFAYGVSRNQFMREILGYFPIEPDGSVTARVPAERPFMISVLDANLRRIGPNGQGSGQRHDVWLQIGSGEVMQCVGCHSGNSELPHGRLDSQPPSANPGATTLGTHIGFPNTPPDLFASAEGETMAEVFDLRRPSGNSSELLHPIWLGRAEALEPLAYTDQWTDSSQFTPEADIDLRYDATWAPSEIPIADTAGSLPDRIVINYPEHIQPIWERDRTTLINMNDGDGNPITNCIGCHDSAGDTEVPAGQLDLTALPSDINADHYRSYRELISGDREQWITDDGRLDDRVQSCPVDEEGNVILDGGAVQGVDEDGNPIFQNVFYNIGSVMSIAGANNSRFFFQCFEGGACGRYTPGTPGTRCTEMGGTPYMPAAVDHTGWLTPAELRLLSEWLDIGGQYYNDPFHPDLSN